MAESTDQAFVLKHRLVGTAVLVLMGIIFLPRVLTETHRTVAAPTENRRADLPELHRSFVSRIEPVSKDVARPAQASQHITTAASNNNVHVPTAVDPKPGSESTLEVNGQQAGWVVRVGVFNDDDNVQRRVSLLSDNGFDVKSEEAELSGKTVIRLFLGPYHSQAEADREHARVMMVINDRAFVVHRP